MWCGCATVAVAVAVAPHTTRTHCRRLFTVESLPKGLLSLHLDKLTPVPPSNASGFRARVDATMGVATGGVVTGKKRA